VLAGAAEGASVTTVEGVGEDPLGRRVQEAMVAAGGVQCGFCTPGFVVALTELLHRNPNPSEWEVREALAGNLCRCTGYIRILEAARRAVGEARA
jgi:aerobic carbon-monoxide dehydrogenase small subunit